MIAWVVAAVVLVAVLGFEILMFRHVGKGPASVSRADARAESAAGESGEANAGAAGITGTALGDASAGDVPARHCHSCGAANDDSVMVRYCWHCLTRLR
jgi:hypothetical protein